jgi:DNA-binding response OmpR family regulator
MNKKKKILIADDDQAITDALTLFFEDVGYEIEVASQATAIREFKTGCPDLLLLDIHLSGQDGREICKQLKGDERTKHIPILIFSANKDTKKFAQEAGADDFIAKPFDLDDLLDKVEQYL